MADDRVKRIAAEIKKALSFIIKEEINDPRISEMASIIKVELTKDIKFAKVFISVYDTKDRKNSTIEALAHAGGFIRKLLGAKVKLRRIPELTFVLDDSIEYSIKISRIIEEVAAKDARDSKT